MAPFFCSGCFGRAVIWEKPSACNIRAMVSSPLHYANQIPAAPAHNPIPRQVRPLLHDVFQCCLLLHRELAWPPRRDVIDQPFHAALVESMHPITQRLPIHPPNARRDLPAHAVPDRSQCKQATRLVGVATCRSSLPKLLGTHPLFERNRHHVQRPRISRITGDGITAEHPEESTRPDSKRRSLRVSLFAGRYYSSQSHPSPTSVIAQRRPRSSCRPSPMLQSKHQAIFRPSFRPSKQPRVPSHRSAQPFPPPKIHDRYCPHRG